MEVGSFLTCSATLDLPRSVKCTGLGTSQSPGVWCWARFEISQIALFDLLLPADVERDC